MRVVPVIAVIAAVAFASVAQADAHAVEKVRYGALIAGKVTATWQCQDQLLPHLPPVQRRTSVIYDPWSMPKHSTAFARAQLNTWTLRYEGCRARLAEKKRQWNWQAFPSWVIRLAVCESGGSGGARAGEPNWFAEGSSSDGTFYSAFNIGRSRYDTVAHHMGVRGWREGWGVPSPYEQAMAVIGYVRLYGDGFTGRCHGIARSSW